MKKSFKLIVSLALLMGLIISACSDKTELGKTYFNLKQISKQNPSLTSLMKGEGSEKNVLKIVPVKDNTTVTVWQTGDKGSWVDSKYFIFEILDAEDYSGVITIEFYRKSENSGTEKVILQSGEMATTSGETPWLTCLMGILPRLKTKVVFPLSYLDAQNIFLTRSPRQLKGTVSGNRLDPADIVKVALRFGPNAEPWFTPKFEIASICLSDTLPLPYPPLEVGIIDKFGQRKDKGWPGKIADEKDLVNQNLELEKSVAGNNFSSEWSKYGGWKVNRFKATGFFRTQHDGRRWWLVDPEGYAFLSVGIDCIRITSSGSVTGIEDLFEWLPGENDPQFSEALSVNRNAKNMDLYRSNIIRVFGDKWKEKWSSVTAGLMRKYNVNTVGNWSDINFARENKIPYVLPLNRFPSTAVQFLPLKKL
jgi:hypothetical protein